MRECRSYFDNFPNQQHNPPAPSILIEDVRKLIDDARQRLAVTVNAEMSMLYWKVGKRINEEVLQGKRAAYGKEVLLTLSQALTLQYGEGWGIKNLGHCLRFALAFSDE